MYLLKSSITEIAESIEKQGIAFGQDAITEAETLIKLCPNYLLLNIDEMVNNISISDVNVTIYVNKKEKIITVNDILKKYNNMIPVFLAIKALCLELAGESGLYNLHLKCQ